MSTLLCQDFANSEPFHSRKGSAWGDLNDITHFAGFRLIGNQIIFRDTCSLSIGRVRREPARERRDGRARERREGGKEEVVLEEKTKALW